MVAVNTPLTEMSDAIAAIVAGAAPAVIAVNTSNSRSSGFVWRAGLVVTADDALGEGDVNVVFADGREAAATVAGRDPTTDIALLRVDTGSAPTRQTRNSPVAVGSLVVVLGADDALPLPALGLAARVAGAWQSQRGGEIDARIDLSVDLRRRAEGGLVLDPSGDTLGMAVFGPRQRALVIPIATVDRVAMRLSQEGRIARGYLGITLQSVATGIGRSGIMVMSTDADGSAAKSDIHQGDIIVGWDGEAVTDARSLVRRLGPDSIGRTVQLDIVRAGKTARAAVTITEKPAP
jgi:S1-C subfamily serine protease